MTATDFDILVIGGDTSGSIAAIAAARGGARTCLVEATAHSGGTCHALANVTPFHNSRGEPVVAGLAQELVTRIGQQGGAREGGHLPNPTGIGGSFTPLDPEIMRSVLFEMADEAGVALWTGTTLIEPVLEGNHARGARVLNKSGTHDIAAKIVIDATGDADFAVRAGVPYTQDVPEAALNATLLFHVAGVDSDAFIADVKRHPERIVLLADPYLREVRSQRVETISARFASIYDTLYIYLSNLVRDYISRADWAHWQISGTDKAQWGRLKPFGARFSIMPHGARKDIVTINATSITFDATDAAALSRAQVEGMRQVHLAMEILRRYVPGFHASFLHTVLPAVSIRASRRVVGEYQLTREDCERGQRFADAIARGAYPMSVQSPVDPSVRQHLFVRDGGEDDIPYRCLVPKGIEQLLIAGRCVSATREASGSTRMGAQCMAYGHAAGVAAALCVSAEASPRLLDIDRLRAELHAHGAIVGMA